MQKADFFALMQNKIHGDSDYESYLNLKSLYDCQKPAETHANEDEMLFMILHQSEELWMKLIFHSLIQVIDYLKQRDTPHVLTLFKRVHLIQRQIIDQMTILETMSPKDYQTIRRLLGEGSGIDSPGFRLQFKIHSYLWSAFKEHYLEKPGLTLREVYDTQYKHGEAFVIAEQLTEYDSLFQAFRYRHLRLVDRVIGPRVASLKGRRTDALTKSAGIHVFPELWAVRTEMTEAWSQAAAQIDKQQA